MKLIMRYCGRRERKVGNKIISSVFKINILIIKNDPSSIIYREGKESAKQILCEQCLLDDTKTEATRFCKSCKDPEPMCETCAKLHIRQKNSRDHELCQDLQKMSKKT